MIIESIKPNIYHIKFPSQYTLASTFIRLQEFYESPFSNIRNNYFTLEQYMDLYADKYGDFTYFTDFVGFNVPDYIIRKFYDMFDELSNKEHGLKDLIKNSIKEWHTNKKFYIVATHEKNSLNHELAHAFFYLNKDYKKQMLALIKKYPIFCKQFTKQLQNDGYGKNVMNDEIQAYLSTSTDTYLKDNFKIKLHNIDKYITEFRQIFSDVKNN